MKYVAWVLVADKLTGHFNYIIEIFLFLIILFIYVIIFGCAGSLLLGRLFCICSEQGLLSRCGVQASHCSGFPCGAWALVHAGFSSCGSLAVEHRLNSCCTRV